MLRDGPTGSFRYEVTAGTCTVNGALAALLESRDLADLARGDVARWFRRRHDAAALLARLRRDGQVHAFETELVGSTGAMRPVMIGARLTDGVIAGVVLDLTRPRRRERAFRQRAAQAVAAEGRFRKLVEHGTNVFFAHTADQVLTYLSPQVRDVLDCEPADAMVRWTDFLTDNPGNAAGYRSTERAIATGLAQPPYELELRGRLGRVVWVEVREAPIVRDGRTVEIVGSLTDITARKEAEATLRRSEASYRHLVEHASYGIYRSSREGRLLAVNRALVEILGYESPEALMATDLRDIYAEPGERDRLIEVFGNLDRILGVETVWKRKDGQLRTVRLSGQPVPDERGRLECFEMIAEDVTEQRALERQLRQAQKMEAIGQLTGGIAHDFNNELSVIILNAQLVSEAVDHGDGVRLEDVRDIVDAAQRAASMTRQLLGFSRRADLTIVPTDLCLVARELAGALRRLVPETIELRVLADPPVAAVRADRGAVEQMLLNLITNARDAMPRGGALELAVAEAAPPPEFALAGSPNADGGWVCVSVRDTGEGMSEDTKSHVFEPFFTTKPVGVGTGLGLAMVYGLMKQHDGFVGVESEVGRGTTVRLSFPAVPGAATSGARRDAAAPPWALNGSETVLLVEDEGALRRVARRALERYGYRVLVAADGEEGLRVFRAHRGDIDVVVSDLVMPGMSGARLLETLRAEGEQVPFIVVSGYAGREALDRQRLDPSVPFIQKPWLLTDLLTQVRRSIDDHPINRG
jgi:PAS domain S-box-containing protein